MPKNSAREIESAAVHQRPLKRGPLAPSSEALAMLARRGFRPMESRRDLPFSEDLDPETADRFSRLMDHYAFRLFLRGAIQKSDGFLPGEVTRYLAASQARQYARILVELGMAAGMPDGRFRLLGTAKSFGGTLEWYVARELSRRFAFDVASGVMLQTQGAGGDFDVIAAGEGKLVVIELKSSPPKNLTIAEIGAFFDRLQWLRPDISLFVVDTALRLSDKILPMLISELEQRYRCPLKPRHIGRDMWAVTRQLYAVNGRRDLIRNIGRAIAEGLLALAPEPWCTAPKSP